MYDQQELDQNSLRIGRLVDNIETAEGDRSDVDMEGVMKSDKSTVQTGNLKIKAPLEDRERYKRAIVCTIKCTESRKRDGMINTCSRPSNCIMETKYNMDILVSTQD